jgi:hypothetical protein
MILNVGSSSRSADLSSEGSETAAGQPNKVGGSPFFLCVFFTMAPFYLRRNLPLALLAAKSSLLAYLFIAFQVVLALLCFRVGIKLWRLDSNAVWPAKRFLVSQNPL